jgi:tRNA G10  N-methylase Trm11
MYGRKKTLDPFCGTGTTLMESLKLGIPCVGIDIVPDIVKCAERNCEKTVKSGRKVNITSMM